MELRKQVALYEKNCMQELQETEMTSLSMFLQSSANTEMVYTILTGITKFALLNFVRVKMTAEQERKHKEMEYYVDQHGDTTITLRQIKIRNINQWDKLKKDDLTEKMSVSVIQTSKEEIIQEEQEDERNTFWKTRPLIQLNDDVVKKGSTLVDDRIEDLDAEEDVETLIPTVTKMTFHKLYEFGKLFEFNKLGLDLLENSFSPDLN